MYGGTTFRYEGRADMKGLSPRVRGNPEILIAKNLFGGSIPACTGEPLRPHSRRRIWAVYPRVYGGTTSGYTRESKFPGLSPRVRGNHKTQTLQEQGWRSIPACTGEPAPGMTAHEKAKVYPRVYGGTSTEFIRLFAAMSLFPGV